MKTGRFKVARVDGGRGHFAFVELCLDSAGTAAIGYPTQASDDDSAFTDEQVESALLGARSAIEKFQPGMGFDVIEFTQFKGSTSDTNNASCWCAGAMAALSALGITDAKIVYEKTSGQWFIERPSVGRLLCPFVRTT